MEKRYRVPALERAHAVLREIAQHPANRKLTALCKSSGISKSTLFSLLQTMEELGWVLQHDDGTYSLGKHFGYMGHAFFNQYDRVALFDREAQRSLHKIGASFHLAELEGSRVLYLAKATSPAPVQMVSGPGARAYAHATGLGKALLADLSNEELLRLFPNEELPRLTPHTIVSRTELLMQLAEIRVCGYALDREEGVMGFQCIAAPVRQADKRATSAVSVSIPLHQWEEKRASALDEIRGLAMRLSLHPSAE
ncbi:IclR family transcriptional regulator [Paenibacillus sp. IB182496]|uniref:IclR family transcriptional regulator n=1 Tax=Paenibacillus sabuli TaxID=2772509 RepID=A0A927BQM5_9BACL|nr:IclR family transcriptional regulator [Paenibacillus sabuli]MBD2844146.1 IclR family transcriptional regulator [Paenibacillus sabuli]